MKDQVKEETKKNLENLLNELTGKLKLQQLVDTLRADEERELVVRDRFTVYTKMAITLWSMDVKDATLGEILGAFSSDDLIIPNRGKMNGSEFQRQIIAESLTRMLWIKLNPVKE